MEINEAIKRIPQMVPEILMIKPQNAAFQVIVQQEDPQSAP